VCGTKIYVLLGLFVSTLLFTEVRLLMKLDLVGSWSKGVETQKPKGFRHFTEPLLRLTALHTFRFLLFWKLSSSS
jgi:hypothetical protein